MSIGIPTITQYGSSYGKFGGSRLSDYKSDTLDTTILNNAEAKEGNELRAFEKSIRDFVLARLGAPTIRVELSTFQIQTCIEEAISKLDYHAPQWMNQYAVFDTSAGVNIYELPPEIANNLTEVWYKRQLFNLAVTPGSLEYDFAIMFFTNTGLFNNFNVGQYVLMQQYLKQIRSALGQKGTWTLVNGRYLHLYPVPDYTEGIILEFRAIDTNTILPAYKNWIQRYALAVAKEILGRIRSKYQTLPGPGGGAKLDGEILLRESADEKKLLMQELMEEIEGPPLFDLA